MRTEGPSDFEILGWVVGFVAHWYCKIIFWLTRKKIEPMDDDDLNF